MKKIDLNNLELTEFTAKSDQKQHCYSTFPLYGAHGTESTAAVYFELDPGDTLGRHTDSAEELLLVLDGRVDAEIGDETGSLSKGEIALVPRMVPHNLTNNAQTRARVLGIFGGSNNIVATFEKEWLPLGTNTVDTSLLPE
ncbi:MAG: cupin domain-containing protein [Balneolaceae bacterium]|nr:cupin domain-containing protein [Balneolaceae bacterium]